MIDVTGLTKYYGNKLGINNVSFSVHRGETVGLLGPNGAGKTTIMKMMAGHMLPTSGTITIDGVDVVDHPKEALQHIGFMPEIPPLYTEMEVNGYLKFIAEIKDIKSKEREKHISEIMNMTAITDVRGRLIKNLSKGYRQRVGLAHALVGYPAVLILDEPTVGLDPKQITEVRKLINNLSKDHTIILSSHILPEIKSTCERVIIITNGKIVLEDTVNNLEESGNTFSIKVLGSCSSVTEALSGVPGLDLLPMGEESSNTEGSCRFIVKGESGTFLREKIFYKLSTAKLPIIELKPIGNSLEEVFLDITK
jgi:ABC-2 type transport system ATP-binding protein